VGVLCSSRGLINMSKSSPNAATSASGPYRASGSPVPSPGRPPRTLFAKVAGGHPDQRLPVPHGARRPPRRRNHTDHHSISSAHARSVSEREVTAHLRRSRPTTPAPASFRAPARRNVRVIREMDNRLADMRCPGYGRAGAGPHRPGRDRDERGSAVLTATLRTANMRSNSCRPLIDPRDGLPHDLAVLDTCIRAVVGVWRAAPIPDVESSIALDQQAALRQDWRAADGATASPGQTGTPSRDSPYPSLPKPGLVRAGSERLPA
jgi:hypothetical protein